MEMWAVTQNCAAYGDCFRARIGRLILSRENLNNKNLLESRLTLKNNLGRRRKSLWQAKMCQMKVSKIHQP